MKVRIWGRGARAAFLLVILGVILGCNFPGLKPTPDFAATAAVRTVSANQTSEAVLQATSMDQTTTPGSQVGSATGTPTATQGTGTPQGCLDRGRFVTDVTVPDGTYLAPGEQFEKVWRVENDGTCEWTTGFDLVFDSGSSFGGEAVVAFSKSVAPGGTIDFTLDLTAPLAEGNYEGNWFLRNADGVLFGLGSKADKPLWIRIIVGSTPTPTSTTTPSPTPTP
jgi:hypothetical protein